MTMTTMTSRNDAAGADDSAERTPRVPWAFLSLIWAIFGATPLFVLLAAVMASRLSPVAHNPYAMVHIGLLIAPAIWLFALIVAIVVRSKAKPDGSATLSNDDVDRYCSRTVMSAFMLALGMSSWAIVFYFFPHTHLLWAVGFGVATVLAYVLMWPRPGELRRA
jgi:hypothetical protein